MVNIVHSIEPSLNQKSVCTSAIVIFLEKEQCWRYDDFTWQKQWCLQQTWCPWWRFTSYTQQDPPFVWFFNLFNPHTANVLLYAEIFYTNQVWAFRFPVTSDKYQSLFTFIWFSMEIKRNWPSQTHRLQ